jgi:tetratricopeptide (TPR) repeat protein
LRNALQALAVLYLSQGRYAAGIPLAQEALDLFIESGNVREIIVTRGYLLLARLAAGEIAEAQALLATNLALAAAGDPATRWLVQQQQAQVAAACGEWRTARSLFEETLRVIIDFEGELSPNRMLVLSTLAWLALELDEPEEAVARCAEGLTIYQRIGPAQYLGRSLSVLAQAARAGLLEERCRLLAAAAAHRRETVEGDVLGFWARHQATVAQVRAALGDAAFSVTWAMGETLSAEAAVDLALTMAATLMAKPATAPRVAEASPRGS